MLSPTSVVLKEVDVHPDLVIELEAGLDGELDDLQTLGFIWFELLVTACYLGVATALVERVLVERAGTAHERVGLGMAVHAAAADARRRRSDASTTARVETTAWPAP